MEDAIIFPHLGIELEHVGQSFSIFGFEVAFYGIAIGLGILAGIGMAAREAKRTNQNTEDYFDLAIVGVIASILGARIYYVIFQWDLYKDDLLSILNFREGGLAIYGGLIVAVITLILVCRKKKLNTRLVADTVAFGLVTGQIIGRWGNFFNREVFGEYTDSLFAMQIPRHAVRDASDISEKMLNNLVNIQGVEFIQVHPAFLYELLWNIGVLVIMLLYRRKKKYDGELFLIYVFGYGVGRFWIEGIRTDQLLLWGTGIPVSQALAAICAIVCGGILIWKRFCFYKEKRTQ
ncbi:prolipoprotein diacylglyceryl transferase [Lachnospiraceae bacterium OttesenSCG-928-E19]|nr:prolipoprotein diacylglyceryl transferase [Lachnospiraceae bacterium OttesenSCG-928-E19]